jgi:hypothetical protein
MLKDIEETIKALGQTNNIEKRTEIFHNWMKSQDDGIKLLYRINWKIPHTLFNVSCKFFNYMVIQNIDWYKIYKTNDTGKWERERANK